MAVLVGHMVRLRCSLLMQVGRLRDGRAKFCLWAWSSAGAAHHGVTNPLDAVPVSTRAHLAGLVLAGLRVVCLRSSGGCSCGVVGSRSSWPPHGRLGLRGFHCAAAGCRSANVVYAAGMSVSVLLSGVVGLSKCSVV